MAITIKVNTAGFRGMAEELSRVSGKDFAEVIRLEAATTLKMAALRVKIASASTIERQLRERFNKFGADRLRLLHIDAALTDVRHEISINTKTDAGRVWFTDDYPDYRTGHGYMIFDAGPGRGWHVPDPVWHDYLLLASERPAILAAALKERLKHRGLERSSWLQIGDAMGVDLSMVAPIGANLQSDIARGASVRGRVFSNGHARESGAGPQWAVTVENASPVAIKRFGQERLNSAINQRVRGFQFAVEKNLLADLQRRARRWPGIFVTA